eukprot:COSAG01_NODE_2451_length_7674_cov_35.760132_3_plen_164_part_00
MGLKQHPPEGVGRTTPPNIENSPRSIFASVKAVSILPETAATNPTIESNVSAPRRVHPNAGPRKFVSSPDMEKNATKKRVLPTTASICKGHALMALVMRYIRLQHTAYLPSLQRTWRLCMVRDCTTHRKSQLSLQHALPAWGQLSSDHLRAPPHSHPRWSETH